MASPFHPVRLDKTHQVSPGIPSPKNLACFLRRGQGWGKSILPPDSRFEEAVGFELFNMPRGGKLSAAGKLFLEDTRRILQEVNEAAARPGRVVRGQSGRPTWLPW
jgi:hypothetical protein